MGRMASLLSSAWLISALGGCFLWTSASQGEQMRLELDTEKQRLQRLEDAQNAQIEQLRQAETKAQQSIEQLEGVIERATSVVQRNSADVTVQVSELETKLAVAEGRLAELQFTVEELKKAQAEAKTVSASASTPAVSEDVIPAEKGEHYGAAYKAYTERDYAKARTLFRAYVERYKSDAQADNAQYWIGASYLLENRPATALAELRKVIESYRTGDAVDEALLDMAEAFYRLKACSDAKTTLDTLIKTQTTSPLLPKAKEKLSAIKKLGSDYCSS